MVTVILPGQAYTAEEAHSDRNTRAGRKLLVGNAGMDLEQADTWQD